MCRYQKKDLIPLQISKRQDLAFIFDHPNFSDGQPHHYVLIKDRKKLVSSLNQQVTRSSSRICCNCFPVFYTVEIYHRHNETCMQNKAASIKLPDESKAISCPETASRQASHFIKCILILCRSSIWWRHAATLLIEAQVRLH